MLIKEGVAQGDPLAMALYGVALLPLAEILHEEQKEVMPPWYADDATMMGKAPAVASCFEKLIKIGPHFGYHPEPAKSFVICPLADKVEAKAAFDEKKLPVKFCRGHRYVLPLLLRAPRPHLHQHSSAALSSVLLSIVQC